MNVTAMNNKVAARPRGGSAPRRNSVGVSVDGGLFIPTGRDSGELLNGMGLNGTGSLETIPGTPTNLLATPQSRFGAARSKGSTNGTPTSAGAVENSV